jgi:hypothetical protein
MIASLADAAETPTEIRMLNKAEPLVVGLGSRVSKSDLAEVMIQLSIEPSGQTPICKQLCDIIEQLRSMESELRATNKIALLIIMTDCDSSDGDIIDVLKPLEGLPLQIIIRMCSDEREITEYWQHINAQLDLDIYVLGEVKAEAVVVAENNSWLTYGEPLHRAREFGLMVPAIDNLDLRQLSKQEIKTVTQILVGKGGQYSLPDPDLDWGSFVEAVYTLSDQSLKIYCPVNRQALPWINLNELANYEADPIRAVVERNESLLWKIYIFYAFNAAVIRRLTLGLPPLKGSMHLKSAPIFYSAAKYEKKLLEEGDLWQLFKDFDFVPIVVNTIRFNKMMSQLNEGQSSSDSIKPKLCFREFIKVMVKISDVAYPYQKPAKRIVRLLTYMERSGNLKRMKETGYMEGVGRLATILESGLSFHLTNKDESTNFDDQKEKSDKFDEISSQTSSPRTVEDEASSEAKASVKRTIDDLLAKRAAETGFLRKLSFSEGPVSPSALISQTQWKEQERER